MFSVTRLDNPVNIEGAALHLSVIDLFIELQYVKERIEPSLVRHHEGKEPGVLSLVLDCHFLREDVLQVLVGLSARAEHMEENLWV